MIETGKKSSYIAPSYLWPITLFIHTFTHTNSGVNHAREQTDCQGQLWLGVLLMDTLTLR